MHGSACLLSFRPIWVTHHEVPSYYIARTAALAFVWSYLGRWDGTATSIGLELHIIYDICEKKWLKLIERYTLIQTKSICPLPNIPVPPDDTQPGVSSDEAHQRFLPMHRVPLSSTHDNPPGFL